MFPVYVIQWKADTARSVYALRHVTEAQWNIKRAVFGRVWERVQNVAVICWWMIKTDLAIMSKSDRNRHASFIGKLFDGGLFREDWCNRVSGFISRVGWCWRSLGSGSVPLRVKVVYKVEAKMLFWAALKGNTKRIRSGNEAGVTSFDPALPPPSLPLSSPSLLFFHTSFPCLSLHSNSPYAFIAFPPLLLSPTLRSSHFTRLSFPFPSSSIPFPLLSFYSLFLLLSFHFPLPSSPFTPPPHHSL